MIGVIFATAFAGMVGVEVMNNEPVAYSEECRNVAIETRNAHVHDNNYFGHDADDDGWGMKAIASEAEAAKRACHAEGR